MRVESNHTARFGRAVSAMHRSCAMKYTPSSHFFLAIDRPSCARARVAWCGPWGATSRAGKAPPAHAPPPCLGRPQRRSPARHQWRAASCPPIRRRRCQAHTGSAVESLAGSLAEPSAMMAETRPESDGWRWAMAAPMAIIAWRVCGFGAPASGRRGASQLAARQTEHRPHLALRSAARSPRRFLVFLLSAFRPAPRQMRKWFRVG